MAAIASSSHFLRRMVAELPFGSPFWYPFEFAVLQTLISPLPENFRKLCVEQLQRVNTIQRGGSWTVLLIGKFRFNENAMDRDVLLPVKQGDLVLSRGKFAVGNQTFPAVLHCQNGALFTINFGTEYKAVRDSTDIRTVLLKSELKTA